ncbi:hypothetical protein [Nevskia ramosa]|uniref:hypothetical protein n=1 Tax=Nevskia ramosa TaxID=64002 RepID=UPI003D11EE0F
MNTKTCFRCLLLKPLDDFYRHPQMADGHLNKCKECTKQDVRSNRVVNIEHYRVYDARRNIRLDRVQMRANYQKTEKGAASVLLAQSGYVKRHPEKRAAHIQLGKAVRDGSVIPQPCQVCGAGNAHGHHENYSRPLDVWWLCPKHHAERHRQLRKKAIRSESAIEAAGNSFI